MTDPALDAIVAKFDDLLFRYWALAHAEGAEGRTHDTDAGDAMETLHALRTMYREALDQGPVVAWRYWKDKFACWEYSDTKLAFPAVPTQTTLEPLYAGRKHPA